jgi:hypothetical protein
MAAMSRKGPRLAALFALGCLLFNYPLLAVFDRQAMVWGVPLVYAYLFGAWALLIALAAWAVRRAD